MSKKKHEGWLVGVWNEKMRFHHLITLSDFIHMNSTLDQVILKSVHIISNSVTLKREYELKWNEICTQGLIGNLASREMLLHRNRIYW